jgi:hypothetical protein
MKSLVSVLLSLLLLSFSATQSYAYYWAAAAGTNGLPLVAYNYPSLSGATSSVLHRCEQDGLGDCKVVASGTSGCFAAAATSANPPRRGYGTATRKFDAGGKALAACQALKAGKCQIIYMDCP